MRVRDKERERHRGTYLILHVTHTNIRPASAAMHCPVATQMGLGVQLEAVC